MSEMITSASSLLKYDTPVIILNNNIERALKGNKPKLEHTSSRPLAMPTNGHLEPIKIQQVWDLYIGIIADNLSDGNILRRLRISQSKHAYREFIRVNIVIQIPIGCIEPRDKIVNIFGQ